MTGCKAWVSSALAAGNTAADRLFFKLKGNVPEPHRIGDRLTLRLTEMAVADGHRVGRLL